LIAVADSSVLIGLSAIGHLHLLKALFGREILIPFAVWREVVEQGEKRPGARQVSSADWIIVQNVDSSDLLRLLKIDLDAGEAEAIVLAKEINADVIFLDERDARKKAKFLDLKILGTIGILIKAKQSGEIQSLEKVLNDLRFQAHFRISDLLFRRALAAVEEN